MIAVAGSPGPTLNAFRWLIDASIQMGNWISCFCTNSWTLAASDFGSFAAPMNSTPRSLYSCWTLVNSGISAVQAAHHVAQKLTTTMRPLRSASCRFWPSTSLSDIFGAVVRLSFARNASSAARAGHDWPAHNPTTRRTERKRPTCMETSCLEPSRVAEHDQVIGKRRVTVPRRRGCLVRDALEAVAVDGERHTEADAMLPLRPGDDRLQRDGDARAAEPFAAAEEVLHRHPFEADAEAPRHGAGPGDPESGAATGEVLIRNRHHPFTRAAAVGLDAADFLRIDQIRAARIQRDLAHRHEAADVADQAEPAVTRLDRLVDGADDVGRYAGGQHPERIRDVVLARRQLQAATDEEVAVRMRVRVEQPGAGRRDDVADAASLCLVTLDEDAVAAKRLRPRRGRERHAKGHLQTLGRLVRDAHVEQVEVVDDLAAFGRAIFLVLGSNEVLVGHLPAPA